MFEQKLPRGYDVAGTGIRVTMHTRQGTRHLRLIAVHQNWLDGLKRAQPHPCRAPAGKETKDHLFPQMTVRPARPYRNKLRQPPAYFIPPLGMSFPYIFNSYRLFFSFHVSQIILDLLTHAVNKKGFASS